MNMNEARFLVALAAIGIKHSTNLGDTRDRLVSKLKIVVAKLEALCSTE